MKVILFTEVSTTQLWQTMLGIKVMNMSRYTLSCRTRIFLFPSQTSSCLFLPRDRLSWSLGRRSCLCLNCIPTSVKKELTSNWGRIKSVSSSRKTRKALIGRQWRTLQTHGRNPWKRTKMICLTILLQDSWNLWRRCTMKEMMKWREPLPSHGMSLKTRIPRLSWVTLAIDFNEEEAENSTIQLQDNASGSSVSINCLCFRLRLNSRVFARLLDTCS